MIRSLNKCYPSYSDTIFRYVALCVMVLLPVTTHAEETSQPYLIGRGMSDITGPSYGVQMWGFGREDQLTEGLHIRQRSRAFIVAEADKPTKRLVFVSADLGSIEHHITLAVIDRLKQQYGDYYSINNVILSATHTHAGPGGYWHSRSDLGLEGGFYPTHFSAIVKGITASIVSAHQDLQPGTIYLEKGNLNNGGANRSVPAYLENPKNERDQYARNTPTAMTLLKFVDDSGPIGMLNWHALHPTAMNYYNRLISGDHKGYASLQMEKMQGTRYTDKGDFVAAFAQSDPGDVTPNTNLDNTGPGITDVETTQIMGGRQLQVALDLFNNAQDTLSGSVESHQIYVNLADYEVGDKFTNAGSQTTCPSAYGYSFAGGSTEDGGGHFLFEEGMTQQSIWLDLLIGWLTGAPKWTAAVKDCQTPKAILFETGSGNPPLQSQIRSITIARIGQLVILAMPTEVTTMAGRRLRATVMNELGDWAQHIVLAGYSNGYAGYVTTPEEYLVQQYEGGHTLHGRWTLPAYQQIVSRLSKALDTNSPVTSSTLYDDWRGKSFETTLKSDDITMSPEGSSYGDPLSLATSTYSKGDTVTVEFWSTNPSAHYVTGNNYMLVEVQKPSGWQTIATDSDWTTTVRWRKQEEYFVATLSWHTPKTIEAGRYRLTHQGQEAEGNVFRGISGNIQIN